ncbi:MAG: cytochrome c3 family protein [Candidatus Latescibacterota bacterium]
MPLQLNHFIRKIPFKSLVLLGGGMGIGFLLVFGVYRGLHLTSTDAFCGMCHVHPHVEVSWKKSTHFKNKSGVVVHCVECHLPPHGVRYVTEKTRLGVRDGFSMVFKDTKKIDWDAKSTVEAAAHFTFDESCLRCHQDLYSLDLTPKGVKAHEYYLKNTGTVRCINCHLTVGHWREKPAEMLNVAAEEAGPKAPVYPPDSGKF